MAEFNYFATFEESLAMLRDIFSRGDIKVCVGQGPFEKEVVRFFTSLSKELIGQLRDVPTAHLFGNFSTHPPVFTKQTMGVDAGKYFLMDDGGGPMVSLRLARERMVEGQLTLLGGDLSTQPQYQLARGRWEKPSQALKDAYLDMQKRMKKHLTRYKQSLWIAPEALRLFESGEARITAAGVLQDLARYDAAKKQKIAEAIANVRKLTARKKSAAKTSRPPRG